MANSLESKLRQAVLDNTPEIVKQLLEKGADPNFLIGGQVSLSWAVYRNYKPIVQLLLEHGAKTNIGQGLPAAGGPLHAAVSRNNLTLTRLLLSKGADPNYCIKDVIGEWGRTPVHAAAENNNAQIAKLLLDAGGDPNLPDTFNQATPVTFAVGHGADKALKVLLAGGGSPKGLINWAATKNNTKVIGLLLDAGTSVSAADDKGWTPLHAAAKADNAKAALFLIEHGAQRDALTKGKETPLEIAEANHSIKVMKLLKK